MTDINNKHLREIMINSFPSKNNIGVASEKFRPKEIKKETFVNSIPSQNTEKNLYSRENFPVFYKENTNTKDLRISGPGPRASSTDLETKKWILCIIISLMCVFIYSEFFLSTLDDYFIGKNISIFDMNGKPKLFLLAGLFIFLVLFSRSMLIFI
jgi:hypothetical protein